MSFPLKSTVERVMQSEHVCVAVDEQLRYLAANDPACNYVKLSREQLIGTSALVRFPEITASENHRNILKALSGFKQTDQLITSRLGDSFLTSYFPIAHEGRIVAVIIEARPA